MPKNSVVCADGTDEKLSDKNTNVVRLYSVPDLSNPAEQIAYYHAGPGAIGDCYTFLMDVYELGDRLFLFGFSRGACTVRALSARLHFLGLIRPKEYNRIAYATEMLKSQLDDEAFRLAAECKATFSRECKSYFEGVWVKQVWFAGEHNDVGGAGYNPPNVPAVTGQEPWVRWNQSSCV